MSVVSRMYDVDNKGYLTKEQQTLRNLDEDGTGKLTAEQLAPLMDNYRKLSQENTKNRRLIWFLFGAVILLGIGTITASVVAANAAKDTKITSDGVLTSKGSNDPVITASQGVSIATIEVFDPKTGSYLQCVPAASALHMYTNFARGMGLTVLKNNTLSAGLDTKISKYEFPVEKVNGDSATHNYTHIQIGSNQIDISPENPCNVLLWEAEHGTGGDRMLKDETAEKEKYGSLGKR